MFTLIALFDSKAGVYERPFMDRSIGVSVRSFADECRKPESPLAQHPEDYMLYHLANFDEQTGKFEVLSEPKVIGEAVRFASPADRKVPEDVPLPFGRQ